MAVEYVIMDKVHRKRTVISGRRIAMASTRNPRSLRWVLIGIYALDSGGWLLYRDSHSRVYHREDTACMIRGGRQAGHPATIDDLPDDAEPCGICHPSAPEDLEEAADHGDMITVRYEWPRPRFNRCATPGMVGEVLSRNEKMTDAGLNVLSMLSAPAADALAQAMADPEFAAAAGEMVTERVG